MERQRKQYTAAFKARVALDLVLRTAEGDGGHPGANFFDRAFPSRFVKMLEDWGKRRE
jgi:hypothetical protein